MYRESSEESSDENKEAQVVAKPPPKPRVTVPDPRQIEITSFDPMQSVEIQKVSDYLDEKLSINHQFSSILPENVDITEEDIVKIFANFKEDMDLIHAGS